MQSSLETISKQNNPYPCSASICTSSKRATQERKNPMFMMSDRSTMICFWPALSQWTDSYTATRVPVGRWVPWDLNAEKGWASLERVGACMTPCLCMCFLCGLLELGGAAGHFLLCHAVNPKFFKGRNGMFSLHPVLGESLAVHAASIDCYH